jgi:hypothetical protein
MIMHDADSELRESPRSRSRLDVRLPGVLTVKLTVSANS